MVSVHNSAFTTVALVASLLVTQSGAWSVGLYSTQNSCGGDWAPDTSRGGNEDVTSGCQGFGVIEIEAMRVTDWADNCKIVAYDSWTCTNALEEFTKEKYPPSESDPTWTCINQLRGHANLANWQALKYECA